MGKGRRLGYVDPNGRHIRVYTSLLDCPAWRVLRFASKALFFDLRAKVNGSNNGNIEATLTTLKHRGWTHPGTLSNALYELRALGFIAMTRGGGVEHGSRVCSLYRFTDLAVAEHPALAIPASPATQEYTRFTAVNEAEAALRTGVKELHEKAVEKKKEAAARKKTTLRNSYPTDTKNVAVEAFSNTKNVAETPSTATKNVAEKPAEKRRKSAPNKALREVARKNDSDSHCYEKRSPLYVTRVKSSKAAAAPFAVDPASRGNSSAPSKTRRPKKSDPPKSQRKTCPECSKSMRSKRADARYCSNSCRQCAYLKRQASAAMR